MESTITKRKATKQEKEIMGFLNLLRNSGVTNMFGATPYIVAEFHIKEKEATSILSLWMKNFNEDGEYNEITIK